MRYLVVALVALFCANVQAQRNAAYSVALAKEKLQELGYNQDDLSDLLVLDSYNSNKGKVNHTFIRQRYQGLEVFNGDIAIHTLNDGSLIHLNQGAVRELASKVNAVEPVLSARAALLKVLVSEEEYQFEIPVQVNEDKTRHRHFYAADQFSEQEPRVQLMLLPLEDDVRLIWEVNYYLPNGSHWWNVRIDAETGQEYERNDWVVECNFDGGDGHCLNHTHDHGAKSFGKTPSAPLAAPNDYNVFAWPEESPSHGPRSIQNAPWNDALNASPFGWHDTDGIAGAEFTTTVGNNVYAQEDRNANNGTDGNVADGGVDLDFDFPIDFTQSPITNEDAAITNLFYWNNIIHDVLYQYGFDEQSGNFQENNYGNGGLGSDFVWADAQDGSGSNNANFGTPDDGSNPRMQMFLWTSPDPDVDGDFDNGIIAHEYGHGWSNRLVGGPSNTNCLFNAEQMGEGWSDYLGLILTMKPGDTRTQGRGIGTYALDQPVSGAGIRPAPYSTDFNVNDYTYGNTNSGVSQPHGIGFVWCTMLWELTWDLIDVYGFDPDIYNGTGGNNIAFKLVSDGLKYTACEPGFVDGRDAILQADQVNYNGANFNLIWSAFARRGLGFSADQGSTTSRSDQVEAFDVPLDSNAAIVQVLNPLPGKLSECDNAPFNLTVQLGNVGVLPFTNVDVAYRINGGAINQETYSGTLQGGASIPYSFSNQETFTNPGLYTIEAWTSLPNDQDPTNDTLTISVELVPNLSIGSNTFEDFEAESLCSTASDCEQGVCPLNGIWFNTVNGNGDDIDWRVNSGGTPSVGTGPAADYSPGTASGKYIYLETSGTCNGVEALLTSPCVDLTGFAAPILSFAYHMEGGDMGSLEVDIHDGTSWNNGVWARSGNQGTDWSLASIGLGAYASSETRIRLRGTTGTGFESDIALDAIDIFDGNQAPEADFSSSANIACPSSLVTFTDQSTFSPTAWTWIFTPSTVTFQNGTNANSPAPQVSFNATGSYDVLLIATNVFGSDSILKVGEVLVNAALSPPVSTDFESENSCNAGCGLTCTLGGIWQNVDDGSDQTNWFVNSGSTPSVGTGPTQDMQPGTSAGKYLYIEASSCFNTEALLVSECLNLNALTAPSLQFSYHMWGSNMGELHVDIENSNGWNLDITPAILGDQGDDWLTRSIDLSAYTGTSVKIRFRGNTGSSFQSDIALDAISVFDGAAPPIADFASNKTTICGNDTLRLSDNSLVFPNAWNWSISPATFVFVNGSSATSQNPEVVFTQPGLYTVSLQVSNNYGSDTKVLNNYVERRSVDPFNLYVTTDQYPSEITWRMLDLSGNVVALGGPYSSSGVQTVEEICYPDSQCFILEFNDSYGDGIFAPGGYVLTTATGDTLVDVDGTSYNTQRLDTFCLDQGAVLDVLALLEGPFLASGLMSDDLRTAGVLPAGEPYTALGYVHVGSGGETLSNAVLSDTGSTAIVDWVMLELRDPADPANVVLSYSALINRTGKLVSPSGGEIRLDINAGQYYVAVRHRNHLGCMTASPIALGGPSNLIDLSDPAFNTWGTNARKVIGQKSVLWAGNVTFDSEVKYVGVSNDRDPILIRIGGSIPTTVTNGYYVEDLNMDNQVKYVGSGNDRDLILVNVGGSVPTAIRTEQLP